MTSLACNKSNVVASNSFCISRAIVHALFATTIALFGLNTTVNADVFSDQKAGFQTNAASMKAIAAAIGGGNYQIVINQAKTISSCAQKIPIYFPEGSESGDTNARAKIQANFEDFTALSDDTKTAANKLLAAAKSDDPGAMMTGLKNLGAAARLATSCTKIKPI